MIFTLIYLRDVDPVNSKMIGDLVKNGGRFEKNIETLFHMSQILLLWRSNDYELVTLAH